MIMQGPTPAGRGAQAEKSTQIQNIIQIHVTFSLSLTSYNKI